MEEPKAKATTDYLLYALPVKIHTALKIEAANKRTSIRQLIMELLNEKYGK